MKRIIVLGMLALSPHSLVAQQSDSLRDEITRQNQAIMDAFNRNDPLEVASYYSDDARIAGPGRVFAGRSEVNGYWTSFPMTGRHWTLEVLETAGDHNTAFQVGRSNIVGARGASITEFIGVWKRQPNGELKLALDAWTGRGRATDAALIDSIRTLDRGWGNSYATHDTVYARALFADDFSVLSGNGSIKSRETELADVRATPGLTMDYFRTSDVDVRVHGSGTFVTGIAEWKFAYNGRSNTLRRRYTALYLRGGPLGWRMIALHMRPAGGEAGA